MLKLFRFFFVFAILLSYSLLFAQTSSQIYRDLEANAIIKGTKTLRFKNQQSIPSYLEFNTNEQPNFENWQNWMHKNLPLEDNQILKQTETFEDNLGITHHRYQQYYNGYPVEWSMYLVHEKNGKVSAINGAIFDIMNCITEPIISKNAAIEIALKSSHAQLFKWQVPAFEQDLKEIQNNPNATYYPNPELVVLPIGKNGKFKQFKLCYKLDIYAVKPLSRNFLYIDAESGEVLKKINRICHSDVAGKAVTKYSGERDITADSFTGGFRLRENTNRKIQTKNDATGNGVDFTDADNFWNNNNAQLDLIAGDIHWGAEVTWSYFKDNYNRNGINGNNGLVTLYAHDPNDANNAYWDGDAGHFGDGDGGFYNPFTDLDIVGHEMVHGYTGYTANLIYDGESGALNESFSDIMGAAVFYNNKTDLFSWRIGAKITMNGTGIRNMANPNEFQNADTYGGDYWNNGDIVHFDSGVQNFWFYLLCEGGSGVNDNNDPYNVTGIGIDAAAPIAYRNLSTYLSPSSDFEDAQFFSIIAAADIYGTCTNEVTQTANAWSAVGVGELTSTLVSADFSSKNKIVCTIPGIVHFKNLTTGGGGPAYAFWDFGDGTFSTDFNPTHTYTAAGVYDVTLVAITCTGDQDTIIKQNFVDVNPNSDFCNVFSLPNSGTGTTITNCKGILRDNGGEENYQNNSNAKVTVNVGANLFLIAEFQDFEFESGFDFLSIYDGPTTNSPLIGKYTGLQLQNQVIYASGSSLTLVQTSDQELSFSGFDMKWECTSIPPPVPSIPANSAITTLNDCSGILFDNGGGGNYQNNSNGQVTIAPAGAETITLNFSEFNLEQGDFLFIYDGGDENAPLIGAFSGSTLPNTNGTIVSTGGSITLLQSTNESVNNTGFKLSWQCSQGNIIKMPNSGSQTYTNCGGIIQDNGGSSKYNNNITSTVVINPPGNTPVALQFTEFAFEDTYDFLSIYNGSSANSPLIGKYTGFMLPNNGVVVASSGAMTLVQETDEWKTENGFTASWTCSACSQTPAANFTITILDDNKIQLSNLSLNGESYVWDFGDGETSTKFNPNHVYSNLNNYNICLTTTNSCGENVYCQSVIINNTFTPTAPSEWQIYPNPTNNTLYISGKFESYKTCNISIYNLLGEEVLHSNYQKNFDVTSLAAGTYLISIKTEKGVTIQKFVKQ